MFIYFWERVRQSASGAGAERKADTESEAGSRLWAVSTESDVGLKLTYSEIMTWAEARRSTDWATLMLVTLQDSCQFLQTKTLACDPAVVFLNSYSSELKTYICIKTCTWMFIEALRVTDQTWEQPNQDALQQVNREL